MTIITNSNSIITYLYLLTYSLTFFFMLKVKNNYHRKGKLNNTNLLLAFLFYCRLSFSKRLTDVASKPTAKHLNSHSLFHS